MVMQGAIYVAEVVVPEAAYAAPTVREQLPAPEYFGVERGYWRVHFDEDHLGVSYPTGILLTLQTAAKDREEAEDKAIASSKKIGEFVDFYTGSPRHPPCLRRLARVSATGGLLEQHDYSYWWPEHPEWFGMAEIKVNQLQMLLGRFGRLGDRPRRNLELAVRWYGISVSSADTLDAYLGAWIGLESIGPLLDGLFHTSGPRAACPTCQNPVGENRDRKIAGINHLIHHEAPDLLVSRSVADLRQVRHDIAHGLKSPEELRALTDRVVADLQLCLAVGILTGVGRSVGEGKAAGQWHASLPRDYDHRPDARASAYLSNELTEISPWRGEWMDFRLSHENERPRRRPDGRYVWASGVHGEWNVKGTGVDPKPKLVDEYVFFERLGVEISNRPELDTRDDVKPMRIMPWRARPLSPAWKRVQERTSASSDTDS